MHFLYHVFYPPRTFKCAICHNNIIVNRPVTTLSGELLCRESISNTLEAGKMKICSVHMHSHAFHYTHIYTSFRCCIERGVITTLWEAYLLSAALTLENLATIYSLVAKPPHDHHLPARKCLGVNIPYTPCRDFRGSRPFMVQIWFRRVTLLSSTPFCEEFQGTLSWRRTQHCPRPCQSRDGPRRRITPFPQRGWE